MSVYQPDCWVVVKLTSGEDSINKVLATFYGGYLSGDSWQMSSGITETKEFDDRYEFLNHSGSIYICYKNFERLSGISASVYSQLDKTYADFTAANPGKLASIEIIRYADITH